MAVVEMALQMFAGHPGEFFEPASSSGALRWRPLMVEHLSEGASAGLLHPLEELGTTLQCLRTFAAVLHETAPPLGNVKLRNAVARAVRERHFRLDEIVQLHGATRPSHARFDHSCEAESALLPYVFGMCWQSFGLVLEELLGEFASELRSLQTELNHERSTNDGTGAITLLRLEQWVEPRWCALQCVRCVLDGVLAEVGRRCLDRPEEQWSEVAAEELIAQLARMVRNEELAGGVAIVDTNSAWLRRLWSGAMRPVLRAMDLWSTAGELHDPCCEFQGVRPSGSGAVSVLMPQLALSGGRHVWALRNWAKPFDAEKGLLLARCAAPGCPPVPLPPTEARRFVPLQEVLVAHALGPARRLCQAAARPLFLRILRDESCGLLKHLAAVRLVAFLERDETVAPFMSRLFEHVRKGTSLCSETLVMQLDAALAEGLDPGGVGEKAASRIAALRRLCLRHVSLTVVPQGRTDATTMGHAANRISLGSLRLRYAAPPPLDRVLDDRALGAYASVMSLLLRIRCAQAALLATHGLPLVGVLDRARRRWVRVPQPPRFLSLAHNCDP